MKEDTIKDFERTYLFMIHNIKTNEEYNKYMEGFK